MKYVGVDLHKKTISACVVVKESDKRKVTARKRLECNDESAIAAWLPRLTGDGSEYVVEVAIAAKE
jgi:hypothetical protein